MLARAQRLRQSSDIKTTIHHGKKYVTPWLVVYVRPGQAKTTRVAFVVGRSVHRSAVRRHRLRRWLAEIARTALSDLLTGASYDMVWVVRPTAVQVQSLEQFRISLWSTLRQIN